MCAAVVMTVQSPVFECALLRDEIWTKRTAVSSPLLLFQHLLSDCLCENRNRKRVVAEQVELIWSSRKRRKRSGVVSYSASSTARPFTLSYISSLSLCWNLSVFIHSTMQHLWKESPRCVLCQHTVHLKSRVLNVWISVCLTESHILQTFDFVGLPDLLGSNLFVSYSAARSSLRAVQPAHTHLLLLIRIFRTPWLNIHCIILCHLFPCFSHLVSSSSSFVLQTSELFPCWFHTSLITDESYSLALSPKLTLSAFLRLHSFLPMPLSLNLPPPSSTSVTPSL